MLNAPAVSGIRNLSTALNRSVGLLITTAVQTTFRKCEYWPLVPLGAIGIIEIHAYGVEFDDFVLCPEMPTSAPNRNRIPRRAQFYPGSKIRVFATGRHEQASGGFE